MKPTQHQPLPRPPLQARLRRRLSCVIGAMGLFSVVFVVPPVHPGERNGSSEEQTLGLWPAPPAEPRVAYVQSIAGPEDLGIRPSAWSRVGNWVTGAGKGRERFVKPFGLAFDEADNLCVTDTGTGWVWYFDRKHKTARHWEKVGHLQFVSPVAVAKRKGIFYVADSVLGKVLAFDARGRVRFEIDGQLERPSGLVISGGRLFVSDAAAHRVAAFDLSGEFRFAFGKRGAAPGEFNFPTYLTADGDGLLLVTDSMNSRIQVFDSEGRFQRLIGSVGDASGHFSRLKGIAADGLGHVYAVDALFDNFQIFDREGRFLLGVGTSGSRPGEFWLPSGIAIDQNHQLFVADSYNHRLQAFKYLGGP